MEAAVGALLAGAGVYATLGLVFAVWFVTIGHRRLDDNPITLAGRLLLVPASALLWPLLGAKWLGAKEEGVR
ncbi:MAG: hypothetical protein AAFX85_15405 [Pseudomonadota bacterium]